MRTRSDGVNFMSCAQPMRNPIGSCRLIDGRFAGIRVALAELEIPGHDGTFDDLLVQLSRVGLGGGVATDKAVRRPPDRCFGAGSADRGRRRDIERVGMRQQRLAERS